MANNKGYKRSWKNYLLDANYQLRFTLTMVAVAAGLMAPLGYWVSEKASRATEVAQAEIDGIECPPILTAQAPPSASEGVVIEEDLLDGALEEPEPKAEPSDDASLEPELEASTEEASTEEGKGAEPDEVAAEEGPAAEEEATGEATEVGSAERDGKRHRADIQVNIDDSQMPSKPVVVVGEMTDLPPTPVEIAASQKANAECVAHVDARRSSVRDRKNLIRWLMVGSGVFLLLGLCVYGIKTTHRVAGPLFKVGLYLAKLEKNVYDTVYNLRKGDQLVEFYDGFKAAHAGATQMQEADRDRLREAIMLAKKAGLVEKDPKMAAVVKDMERLLAEKEESLGQKQA